MCFVCVCVFCVCVHVCNKQLIRRTQMDRQTDTREDKPTDKMMNLKTVSTNGSLKLQQWERKTDRQNIRDRRTQAQQTMFCLLVA